jgi:hypothetical protein
VIVRSAMGTASDRCEHELRALVAAVRWGTADPEVVDSIASRVPNGDGSAWVQEWTAAGGAAWVEATSGGNASMYLRAASYYAAALALIDASDGLVNEGRLWERQRECWDRAARGLGGERLAIPYEDTSLPAYFFSAGSGARPLVIIDHGGRAATSSAWAVGGAAAGECGYHWMTFDGPGRQAALRRQGLVLRPDWEAVLGPVADAMTARADVDASRMAVIGIDHAGYGIARALAFEPRFSAAMLAPAILDAARPWMEALPGPARAAVLDEDREWFDREFISRRCSLRRPPSASGAWGADTTYLNFRCTTWRGGSASSASVRRSHGSRRRCSPVRSGPSRCGPHRPRTSARGCRARSWLAPRPGITPCQRGSIGSVNADYQGL